MRLLTFLGTGNYNVTTYWWQDRDQVREVRTAYAPVATARMIEPDEAVLLGTQKAFDTHLQAIRQELETICAVRCLLVPAGRNEDELWQLFQTFTDAAQDAGSLALDVTHGFRSQPMVALLAAAFLQSSRQINVAHVLYSAYEAREELPDGTSRTPIFDLTPMFDLSRWAAATDRFGGSGDAEPLAQLLKAAKPPYREFRDDAHKREQQRKMGLAVAPLRQVSRALRLVRPYETMRQAAELDQRLADLAASLPPRAAPFGYLLESIRAAYRDMALASDQHDDHWQILSRQRAQLHWYIQHGQYAQAATLAREWLVSWILAREGVRDLLDKSARHRAENTLGQAWTCAKLGHRATLPQEKGLPADLHLAPVFGKLTRVRNDIDHAGMRRDPLPADKLRESVRELIKTLERLPLGPACGTMEP